MDCQCFWHFFIKVRYSVNGLKPKKVQVHNLTLKQQQQQQ